MNSIKTSLVKGFSKSVVFVMAQMYVVWSGVQSVNFQNAKADRSIHVTTPVVS